MNAYIQDDGSPKHITLGDYLGSHPRSSPDRKAVIVPPDYDACFEALNQAQPPTQPQPLLRLKLPPCDKCGHGGAVYAEPYTLSPNMICEDCDDQLERLICNVLDRFQHLAWHASRHIIPQWNGEALMPSDVRYLPARAIVDAFFWKPPKDE